MLKNFSTNLKLLRKKISWRSYSNYIVIFYSNYMHRKTKFQTQFYHFSNQFDFLDNYLGLELGFLTFTTIKRLDWII